MPIRIHERLKNVYGDATRSGRPGTAGNIQRVDDIIRGDRWVKTDELCRILSFSKGSVIMIIHHCGIHFKDEEAMKTSVHQWLRRQGLAFYRAGIHALVKRWTKRWKWTEIILKSDILIVNVVVFKLCKCI